MRIPTPNYSAVTYSFRQSYSVALKDNIFGSCTVLMYNVSNYDVMSISNMAAVDVAHLLPVSNSMTSMSSEGDISPSVKFRAY